MAITVDEIAEEYRIALGLRPWSEHYLDAIQHALNARDTLGADECKRAIKDERRTGRTTKAVLRAIASCVRRGNKVLWFGGEHEIARDNARLVARDAIERLGLDIETKMHRYTMKVWPEELFYDHYQGDQNRGLYR